MQKEIEINQTSFWVMNWIYRFFTTNILNFLNMRNKAKPIISDSEYKTLLILHRKADNKQNTRYMIIYFFSID